MHQIDLDYFETIFVYKCLVDPIYLSSVIDYSKPEYFKDKNIKCIFDIIQKFHQVRNSAPTLTEIKAYLTSPELKNAFKTVVGTFPGIDKNFNNAELLTNTEQFLKERAVYTTLMSVVDDLGNKKAEPANILRQFERACNICLNHDAGLNIFTDIKRVITDLHAQTPCLSTGWKWLDNKLDGGFLEQGRALYIFAGETNVGKSIFLGNIATSIATNGKTVLLVTLEMSELMYAKRLCSNVTQIPITQLKSNSAILEHEINELAKKQPKAGIIIKEFPPSTITVNNLRAFIDKLLSKGIKIDAIVLDYVNLLHTTEGNNSYERVKYITEQLRALTYIYMCPIISATQLNRCLDVNSEVILEDGSQRPIGQLKVGEKIRGKNKNVVVRYIYPKERQKCFKITTKSGKVIQCSENHLFPTSTGEVKSLAYKGLKVGDKLLSLAASQE